MPGIITPHALSIIQYTLSISNVLFPLPQNCRLVLTANSANIKLKGHREGIVVVRSLSHVQLFVTPWTVARQAPLSMGISKQEYWSGLPFSSPGDLPDPGIEPRFPALQVDSFPHELPGKAQLIE